MMTASTATLMWTADLREQVDAALEYLSKLSMEHATTSAGPGAPAELDRLRQLTRFLGQVAAGWPNVPPNALPLDLAGYGSTVTVVDAEHGSRESFTLMTGALVDIDAGQVSLASPIGQALTGTRVGNVIDVELPQRRRRLRVTAVRTLSDRIREEIPREAGYASATLTLNDGRG